MRLFFIIFFGVLWSGGAFATPVEDIETYLNSLKTLRAEFNQVSTIGDYATGTFYLDKSNPKATLMRLKYDAPTAIDIYGKGDTLTFHDRELRQTSYFQAEETPAGILMQPTIDFSKDLVIKDVIHTPRYTEVVLTKPELSETYAEVRLLFARDPLKLHSWVLTDLQGVVTEVVLKDLAANVPLDQGVFTFYDPNFFKTR